jgi:phage-related protein
VFRVYGMAVNPQILLTGTDYRIALTGTISAGDYLEVDVQNRSITVNGTTPALNFLDAANTTWFELPKGTSTVQMLAGAFDTSAKVSVLYRAAYT